MFGLGEMTEGGRLQAISAMDTLQADGGTNIWSGLLTGMNALQNVHSALPRKKSLLLLTDGQPSVKPPRGHEVEMRNYLESHPGFQFQLNTFGFGYGLDSSLLANLAVEGNGTFSFIPDAKIVGTCFVNCIANALSTYTQKATLHLMLRSNATFDGPVLGKLSSLDTEWGRVINLGPLLSGQVRDIVVPVTVENANSTFIEALLVWENEHGVETTISALNDSSSEVESPQHAHFIAACSRNNVVDIVLNAVENALQGKSYTANSSLMEICGKMQEDLLVAQANATTTGCSTNQLEALNHLFEDVSGRMTKALTTKERFNRWGKHYLRAIARAHQLQQCTNFMDPGLQSYGGILFNKLSEIGGNIFVSLPNPTNTAPASTTIVYQQSSSGYSSSGQSSPDMSNYYAGSGGGCFGPESTVLLVSDPSGHDNTCDDGSLKIVAVKDIRAGDQIIVSTESNRKTVANVICVVQIHGKKDLVAIPGGLTVTPRHPISFGSNSIDMCKWQLPADIVKDGGAKVIESDVVFNFVLDSSHVVLVNGVQCVTLGHGLQGDIVSHDFYGTSKVIDALRSVSGWEKGLIRLDDSIRSCCQGYIQ